MYTKCYSTTKAEESKHDFYEEFFYDIGKNIRLISCNELKIITDCQQNCRCNKCKNNDNIINCYFIFEFIFFFLFCKK